MTSIRRLRKGLRDVRDRTAVRNDCWQSVALAGLLSETTALVLIQHAGIHREDVLDILARRWPGIVMTNVRDAEPSWRMSVDQAAALGRRRRGIEGIRIVVPPQLIAGMAEKGLGEDEAMPMAF
jgi:hypothetical protein